MTATQSAKLAITVSLAVMCVQRIVNVEQARLAVAAMVSDREETCDDGNTVTESCAYGAVGCTVCDSDCTEIPGGLRFCGDGVKDPEEPCDDGNADDGDECTSNCVLTTCGNGILDVGEECDDGNLATEDCAYGAQSCEVCAANCTTRSGETAFCGDGVFSTWVKSAMTVIVRSNCVLGGEGGVRFVRVLAHLKRDCSGAVMASSILRNSARRQYPRR